MDKMNTWDKTNTGFQTTTNGNDESSDDEFGIIKTAKERTLSNYEVRSTQAHWSQKFIKKAAEIQVKSEIQTDKYNEELGTE